MGTLYRNGVPYIGGGSGSEEASQIHYDNTKSGIPSTSVQGAIDELNNGLVSLDSTTIESFDGAAAVNAARGNPATVSNAKGGNALGVNATLEPIQDLHGYDHPWAGGAGKNLANLSEVTGGTVTGESVTVQGGTASYQAAYILMNLKGGTTYTFSARATRVDDIARISFRNVGNNQNVAVSSLITSPGNLSVSYTPPRDVDMRLSMFATYGTANPDVATVYEDIQIEESSEPTAYEPYSNICPITGRTQVDVKRTGKNLLNHDRWKNVSTMRGTAVFENNGVTLTATGNNAYTNHLAASENYCSIPINEGETVTLSWEETTNEAGGVFIFGNNSTVAGDFVTTNNSRAKSLSYTAKSGITFITFRFGVTNSGTTIAYKNIQIVKGSNATAYEPYQGQSVTVQLGQTVYGGTLNVTTGELTVETAYIASYNGEAIGEPWWSSMDEYVAGATPTTGAQVVYTLATPTTVSLTPTQIQLLTGTNIISTSADGILVRYYVSGKPGNVEGSLTYLSDEIAELDAGKTDYFVIENDTDLNTLLKSGVYRSPNTTTGVGTLVNCPMSAPFTMIVTGAGTVTTGCVQVIFNDFKIYVRRGNSSGFLSWASFSRDKGPVCQFSATGWTTTETVNGTTYYTQTVSISSVSGNPIVGISPISGTLPTSAEQSAFDSVSYFTADNTTNTIKAYAESAPTNDFAVVVR